MIYSIRCDQPSFKTVIFQPGFNVILAERTKEATKKDSRNGLGKSTLIEIINFCLGGNKGETLKKPQLENWSFAIEIDLGGNKFSVTRNTSSQNKILIDGDCSKWPIQPTFDTQSSKFVLSSRDWTNVLGIVMFNLPPRGDVEYGPTFRSAISYFVRSGDKRRGAFLDPFSYDKGQKVWNVQVNNAFLLSLGWEYASKLNVLKDRGKVIDQIKKEAKSGILSTMMGSLGELEATKIRLEAQVKKEEEQLSNFKVHLQYKQLESEANDLTVQIHELVNENINENRLLEYYEASLKEEVDAKREVISKIYQESGIVFPDITTKKIDEVLQFHQQVVKNRKGFLNTEIERLKNAIAEQEQKIKDLTNSRADRMMVLKKHGALDEYTRLQYNYQRIVAELKDLIIRIENLKKFEQGRSAINVDQELLYQRANTDLNERQSQRENAILLFNANSQALYEAPGTLSIDLDKTGFKFNVSIERSGSHGIGNMKIFCYDLMLAQLWAKKMSPPGFLIHDSIIFADVDERQKALALELAARESEKNGFQYICTMNSDSIPESDFNKGFDFGKNVRLKLTDAAEDGGILGIRF
jgi:uncharacterized protein YydD (DUF2326 family)